MKFAIRLEKEGKETIIPLVGTISAGRVALHNDQENLIVDSHQTVSRRHALFINKGEEVLLMDCGSVNQTYLNGSPIESNKEIRIKPGDTIRLAESTSVITIETGKEQEQERIHSRSRSREKEKQKKKTTVSASTKKMLKGIEKYKSRQEKIKFLKLMGHKNAEEELDLIEAETSGKVNFDRANEQIEKQFEQGRRNGGIKKGLGV